ncbi:MAG TPA: MFS transporter, partial [Thermomicrobiales bacterium]|nr:MFS transporter [Thermomicrobiales bacterium]
RGGRTKDEGRRTKAVGLRSSSFVLRPSFSLLISHLSLPCGSIAVAGRRGDAAGETRVEEAGERGHDLAGWRRFALYAMIVFVGMNLRSVMLAVPPVLALIQRDLALSYTLTGLLTALPVLMLGSVALPAGLLTGRLGGRTMVALGLGCLAAGALLRAVAPRSAVLLYLFTALLSLGVALGQTAMPVLVRVWYPARIGLVAALFTDGLIVGEALAAALTVPVVMRGWLGAENWPATFVVWGVPVVAALALWLVLAPPAPPTGARAVAWPWRRPAGKPAARTRVSAWHLGLLGGAGSLVYFSMNAFIAPYDAALGQAAAAGAALTALNTAQLPVTLALTLVAQRVAGERWPFVATGVCALVGVAGWVWSPIAWQPAWAALLGGSASVTLVLGMALPPLLASREEVARLTGATLALTYIVAFFGPLIGGRLWDTLHVPAVAFLPVAVAGLTLIVLGAMLPARDEGVVGRQSSVVSQESGVDG